MKSGLLSELINEQEHFENGSCPCGRQYYSVIIIFLVEGPNCISHNNYQACYFSKVTKLCLKEHHPIHQS